MVESYLLYYLSNLKKKYVVVLSLMNSDPVLSNVSDMMKTHCFTKKVNKMTFLCENMIKTGVSQINASISRADGP